MGAAAALRGPPRRKRAPWADGARRPLAGGSEESHGFERREEEDKELAQLRRTLSPWVCFGFVGSV